MLKKIPYLVFLLILLSSCTKNIYLTTPKNPVKEADQAYKEEKWLKSKVLYQKLLATPNLDLQSKTLFLKRLAKSSLEVKDFQLAQDSLLQLFTLNPEEKKDWENQKILSLSLKETQGIDEFKEYLLRLGLDSDLPFSLKREMGFFLLQELPEKDLADAYSILEEVYNSLTIEEKKTLEEDFYYYLANKDGKSLESLKAKIWNEEKFPQNIITFVYFFNLAQSESTDWSFYWSKLKVLLKKANFSSPLFQNLFAEKENSLGIPEQKIALILPLEGPYASFGWKILKGASLAQWKLLGEGQKVDLIIFNSLDSSWPEQVLQTSAKVIGGPLIPDNIARVLQNKLYEKKLFFTFSPSAEKEGEEIWRFFPSAEDQVRILIKQTHEQLGINNFAILYPEENYGQRMSKVFYQVLNQQGGELRGLTSYPPSSPPKWGKKVAQLLKVEEKTQEEEKLETFPEPDFEAVFIPDNLSRVKAIASYFFFYNEPRLFFLGPSLWANPDELSDLEKIYLTLAFYPSPWWSANPSFEVSELKQLLKESVQGEPDFWVGLGFDFVRFFASLPIYPHLPADKVNELLSNKSRDFNWTIAPLTWNEEGKATEDLFLFSLYQGENKLADLNLLQNIRAKRIENRKVKKIEYYKKHNLPLPEEDTNSTLEEKSNENN